jgi:catechol 2,3-dioxygenase-like lactoylglutathione lyase family enzyme
MPQMLFQVTFLVRDYDEAIAFFVYKLGFLLVQDTPLGESKRWVIVKPNGPTDAALLLAKADSPSQLAAIGNQTGDRVGFFLQTDDFWRDHQAMLSRGVKFLESPREEPYGTVAVFEDLYGNKWDLIMPAASA